MIKTVQVLPAVALAFALAATPALARPLPFVDLAPAEPFQLVAAERSTSKVESTKAWLKTKKSQTSRWMGRQKQKLKTLVD